MGCTRGGLVNELKPLPWFLGKGSHYTYVNPVPYIVLDWETTNLEYGTPINPNNRLVLGCWRLVLPNGATRDRYIFGDEYDMQPLLDDIEEVKKQHGFIVAHNAKFELAWLRRCGLDLRSVLAYCTMLGQWVLDGNQNPGRSLEDLAVRYKLGASKGNLVSRLIEAGVCPSAIRRDWLLKYCQQDVELCHRVFVQQVRLLEERRQLHLAHVRNLTCACLADIEFEGMCLDKEAVKAEYEKTHGEWLDTGAQLYEITGGINLGSPKQLAEYLYTTLGFKVPTDFRGKPLLTGSGQPSTNANVLAKLSATNPRQEQFLRVYKRYNKLDSLLSKNLNFFKAVCEQYDGVFYGSFNQGIVGTHRLSSSGRPLLFAGEKKTKGAQLQNLPRDYKRLFWSGDEDWLIVEPDGAQLEFRVGAELGHDPVATKEIEEGADVHSVTAATLTAAGEPTTRQEAKSRTFRPLYGGSTGTPAEVAYCEFFKAKYTGIAKTQEEWTYKVLNDKQLRTPYGMVFYWPDTVRSRSGYISNTTQIYNYPVQGFATGEIIPIALVHFWHRTAGYRVRIFTTIHDSIGAKVHKDDVEVAKLLSKIALTTDVYRFLEEIYDYKFTVPLGVGFKVSRNWGYTKTEHSWNVWPDGRETYSIKE
jgi:DNA polymerase I-like protein with 3'-5' exonuclease and polymerase domains